MLRLLVLGVVMLAARADVWAGGGQSEQPRSADQRGDDGLLAESLPSPAVDSPPAASDSQAGDFSIKLSAPEEVLNDPDAIVLEAPLGPDLDGSYLPLGWRRAADWSSINWRPGHGDRFGEFSVEGASVYAVKGWDGLSLTSGSGFHFLSGPWQTDMPARLFDFRGGLHFHREVLCGCWVDAAVSAGVYTDFEDSVRDGWRFPAHAVVSWQWTPEVISVAGVEYFDRLDLGLLPVAGVILHPDPAVRLELLFPEPRVGWRVSVGEDCQRWLLLGGRIGGGEWVIERLDTDLADIVSYNELQLVLSFETVKGDQSASAWEIGYLFERELQYRSGIGDYQPGDTFFLRLVSRK